MRQHVEEARARPRSPRPAEPASGPAVGVAPSTITGSAGPLHRQPARQHRGLHAGNRGDAPAQLLVQRLARPVAE